jgi:hypothetical protein
MEKIDEQSLLRCTIKKSASVLPKVVLIASKIIVGFVVIAEILLGVAKIWELGSPIGAFVLSILLAIPWYVYVSILALMTIPMYSLLWCIARNLTEEDWMSDEANNVAITLALALAALALAIVITLAITLATVITLALTLALALAIIDPKTFLFIGAYLHYRKRIREQNLAEGM